MPLTCRLKQAAAQFGWTRKKNRTSCKILKMGNQKRRGKYYQRKKKYFGRQTEINHSDREEEEEERPEVTHSASFQKLLGSKPWWMNEQEVESADADSSDSSFSEDSDSSEHDDVFEVGAGNRLVDLELLRDNLLKHALYSSCKLGNLVLEETRRHGLGSHVSLSCTTRNASLL